MKLLLIEDHKEIAGTIFDYFEIKGYVLDYAANGEQGLELCNSHHYDVVILDVMLPQLSGLEVCQQLRDSGINTPVLMLTARDQKKDELLGFEHGADDYLVKPFDLKILEARVTALYRRHLGQVAAKKIIFGKLSLDLNSRTATREERQFPLNHIQFTILKILMTRAPNLASREEIVNAIWSDNEPDGDILRSHIYQLRNQIDKPFKNQYIHTVPKKGYQLVNDEMNEETSNH